MRKVIIVLIVAAILFGAAGCFSDPEADKQTLIEIYNAASIVNAVNAYNALNRGNELSNNVTLEEAQETLGDDLWPRGIWDEDARAAWKWVVIRNGEAYLTDEAQDKWDRLMK